MAVPIAPTWNILNFAEGMNIGPGGERWFVNEAVDPGCAGQGLGHDWGVTAGAAWGIDYGRVGNTEFNLITGALFPNQLGLGPLPAAYRATMTHCSVSVLAEITTAVADNDFFVHAVRSADGRGGAVSFRFNRVALDWTLTRYNPSSATFEDVETYPIGDPRDLRIFLGYDGANDICHLWVDGLYKGGMTGALLPGTVTSPFTRLGRSGNHSILIKEWTISSGFGGPSLKPIADAGLDKVAPIRRTVGLDGGKSVDHDGNPLSYIWKLVGAPSGSAALYEKRNGSVTSPSIFEDVTGIDYVADGICVGDILVVEGKPYEINTVAPTQLQVNGILPAGYSGRYQIVKQAALLVGADSRILALLPDVLGLYLVMLTVADDLGSLSEPDLAVVNVVNESVPLSIPLDMGFLWEYLSDFWTTVEGTAWVPAYWMAIARITGSYMQDLWNVDFDKSLITTQEVVCRRWLPYHPYVEEVLPDSATFCNRQPPVISDGAVDEPALVGNLSVDVNLDVTVHLEDGPSTLRITVLAGTMLVSGIPDSFNAQLAAGGFDFITCSWLDVHPNMPDIAPGPPPIRGRRYGLVFKSTSYKFSVLEIVSTLFFQGIKTSEFSGDQAVRQDSRNVRLSSGDWDLGKGMQDLSSQVQPGDILNLAGRSYNIVNVSHYTNTWFQKCLAIEVDKDIPEDAPDSMHWCIPSYWKSFSTDWYDLGVTSGDILFLDQKDIDDDSARSYEIEVDVAGAGYRTIGTLAPKVFWPTRSCSLRGSRRHFYVKVPDETLAVPRLQEAPDSPTWYMEEFRDYVLDERREGRYLVLDFRKEPDLEMELLSFYRDKTDVSFLDRYLWGEASYLDNRSTIEANFGRMVNAHVEDFAQFRRVNYLSVVTGLWKAYTGGAKPGNMEIACAIIAGYPYAEAKGMILKIVENFFGDLSYALIQDADQSAIIRAYLFNTQLNELAVSPITGAKYEAGDTIEQHALLVDAQIYYDHVNDPDFVKLMVGSGTSEVEKVHRFGIFMDPTLSDPASWPEIVEFVLDFKKSNTYPFFAALLRLRSSITISDKLDLTVILSLKTALWRWPTPPALDIPRLGSGIMIEPSGKPDSAVLYRMFVPGAIGTPLNPGTYVRISYRSAAALSVSVVVNDITVNYVRGVTTAAAVKTAVNAEPAAAAMVSAYLPTGFAGLDTIDGDYGPVIVNHRGRYQARFDMSEGPYPGISGYSVLTDMNSASVTVMREAIGSTVLPNVIAAPLDPGVYVLSGVFPQVGTDPRYHDNGTALVPPPTKPVKTLLVPEEDWLVFYEGLGLGAYGYRCHGKVVGTDPRSPSDTVPGFFNGDGGVLHGIHVHVDPALPGPVKGDAIQVYRGMPSRRVMDWNIGTDTKLASYSGPAATGNFIGGVALVGGPARYQISVVAPRQFSKPGGPPWLTSLRPGADYFLIFSNLGTIKSYGVLSSVLNNVSVEIDISPWTLTPPAVGDSFIVLRDPAYTELTEEFIELINQRRYGTNVHLPGSGLTVV